MRGEDTSDTLYARLDRIGIVGGAVLPQQLFQHVSGNDRVAFHSGHQVFADSQSSKVLIDSIV